MKVMQRKQSVVKQNSLSGIVTYSMNSANKTNPVTYILVLHIQIFSMTNKQDKSIRKMTMLK